MAHSQRATSTDCPIAFHAKHPADLQRDDERSVGEHEHECFPDVDRSVGDDVAGVVDTAAAAAGDGVVAILAKELIVTGTTDDRVTAVATIDSSAPATTLMETIAVSVAPPCVAVVTLVSVGVPSKLSALAPFVPVIKFAISAVSSFAVNESGTMSATAVTLIVSGADTMPNPASFTVKLNVPRAKPLVFVARYVMVGTVPAVTIKSVCRETTPSSSIGRARLTSSRILGNRRRPRPRRTFAENNSRNQFFQKIMLAPGG